MSKKLSSGEIKRFKKDNNNLSKDNYLEAVKLYDRSNGKIPSFINPIAKRIKFIYIKCLGNFKPKTPKIDKKKLEKLPKTKIDKKKLEKLPKPKIDKKKLEKLPKTKIDKKKLEKLPKTNIDKKKL